MSFDQDQKEDVYLSGSDFALMKDHIENLQRQVDSATNMLASWVVSIDIVGTDWDDWDENYKDAAYGRDPYIGEMLREKIKHLKKLKQKS